MKGGIHVFFFKLGEHSARERERKGERKESD